MTSVSWLSDYIAQEQRKSGKAVSQSVEDKL